MDGDRERHTAIHEAGHAVAYIRLNLDHGGAEIVPKEEAGTLGSAAGEGLEHVWDKEQAGPAVLALCAGYAALAAAGHGDDVARGGTDSDFESAEHLIDFWALSGTLEDWMARAVVLMSSPENVAAVAKVAEHLLEHKRLDGDYIAVLVELADGDCTEQEFKQYLQNRGGLR